MKHYAGIDLSMETSHVCVVVDADGRKVGDNAWTVLRRRSPRCWNSMGLLSAR